MTVQTALSSIGDVLVTVSGIRRVYVQGDTNERGWPDAINEWPAALVALDPDGLVENRPSHQRTIANVSVTILHGAGASKPSQLNALVPMIDSLRDTFVANAQLAGDCQWIESRGWEGPGMFQFGGEQYEGIKWRFQMCVHTAVAYAAGSI